MEMRVRQGAVISTMDEEECDGGCAAAAEWKTRIVAVSQHIEHEVQVHLPDPSDGN
jgi:hypothetical protein